MIKGTVNVISSDPPCKDAFPDSQRCPEKLCLIGYELDINVYSLENYLFCPVDFKTKVACAFLFFTAKTAGLLNITL